MKKLIILSALFISHSVLACMPYMPGIKHGLVMAALDVAAREKGAYAQDLKTSDISDLSFAWIKTDSRYMCHDRETATVDLEYTVKDKAPRKIRVNLQMDEGKMTKFEVLESAVATQ